MMKWKLAGVALVMAVVGVLAVTITSAAETSALLKVSFIAFGTEPSTWISDELVTGEKVNVTYQASHDSLDDYGDVTTVLDRHLDLLVLFCQRTGVQGDEEPRPEHADCKCAGFERGGTVRSLRVGLHGAQLMRPTLGADGEGANKDRSPTGYF
jgi:hypothetical protein